MWPLRSSTGRDPSSCQPDVPIISHPPSKHMKKLVFGLPTELLQLLLVTTGWLQTEMGQAWHSQHLPLFYSDSTTHHTKPEQDVAPAIYSAKIPTAQEENQQWKPRIPSSPPPKDVKPCDLTPSCKLKVLTAVNGSVLFFYHWWQMVCAIIKS